MANLVIKNLHVQLTEDSSVKILDGLSLTIEQGKVHALMGQNGSGKSTLSSVIMGHPKYEIIEGEIFFGDINILELPTEERARLGIFLAFQYPIAVPGVTLANFLRLAINAKRKAANPEDKGMPIPEFRKMLKTKMTDLSMDHSFAGRYLNDGFSGGEKKKAEVLQMAVLEPKIAILDETDSGLDIDALRIVSDDINNLRGDELGILVITHYQRMLEYIHPDTVHIIIDGKICVSGGFELSEELETIGYEGIRAKYL